MVVLEEQLMKARDDLMAESGVFIPVPDAKEEAIIERIFDLAKVTGRHKVLDVACGAGYFSRYVEPRCQRITGVDDNPVLLAFFREGIAATYTFSLGADDLPHLEHMPNYSDESFNVVVCQSGFRKQKNPAAVLSEMFRVLVPGGTICVADIVGTTDSDGRRQHNELLQLVEADHKDLLTIEGYEKLLQDVDLTITGREEIELDYEIGEWLGKFGIDDTVAEKAREMIAGWLGDDAADLDVREENGAIRFRQRFEVFIGQK